MKKLSLLALTAVALAACGDNLATPEDYVTINTEIQKSSSNDAPISIVALGQGGDYIVSLPATDALTKIASKKKTVTFLSIDNPAQYAAEGTCLLNIIPDNTMASMNTPENKCNFRLFCGTAADMETEFYAVEVCSE